LLQEATDELFGGDSAILVSPGFGVFVAKGDVIVFHFQDTIVTDGHPPDVGSQILQGSYSAADRLTMNHSVFRSRLGGDQVKQGGLFQFIAELSPKYDRGRLDVNQKALPGKDVMSDERDRTMVGLMVGAGLRVGVESFVGRQKTNSQG